MLSRWHCRHWQSSIATGAEVRTIPLDVLEFTRSQIADKRKSAAYSDSEWRYHLRLAERLDPSFAE